MMKATLVAGLLVFMVPSFGDAQNQLFEGTWKANIAKSKYEPGVAIRSETLRFEPVGDRFKVSLDGENQQGKYHSEATGTFDTAFYGLSREKGRYAPAAAPQFGRQGALARSGFLQRGFIVRRVDFDGVADAVASHEI